MTKKRRRFLLAGVALIVLSLFSYSLYINSKIFSIADKQELSALTKALTLSAENVQSTDKILKLLTDWCDDHNVSYKQDSNKNIIITKKAENARKDTEVTVLAVEYNSKTLTNDISALATAEYVSKHGLNGGDVNVIFLYNDGNYHTGARNISKKYVPSHSRIILLNGGKSTYISNTSYANAMQTVAIPYTSVSNSCDSAIEIRIGGLETGIPSDSISNQTNPITQLGTVLTWLKTKSTTFQLADVKVESNGDMYPTAITAKILINSYSLESVSSYLDKRIESFEEDNKDDYPNSYYEYKEITDNIPTKAYSQKATNRLITFLYTFKNGTYRFDKETLPEGGDYKEKDIYGVNCLENLWTDDGALKLRISTSALNNDYLKKITNENEEAATLSKVKILTDVTYSAYTNKESTLQTLIQKAYAKVNDNSTVDSSIKEKSDSGFTAMTFLAAKNKNTDAVHIQLSEETDVKAVNAILNYPVMDRNVFGF